MAIAKRGAIAAGHALTAEAGAEILADGGNAFDATIAALWMACVCEPVLASPGGGGFLTALSDGRTGVFDFFPSTPAGAKRAEDLEFVEVSVDFGTARQAFNIGAGASAVPGFVPGLFAVHETFASMPMRRLAEPAVAAARSGFEIAPLQSYLFQVVEPIYRWSADAEALFLPGGKAPQPGTPARNPELADAIEAICQEGLRIATEGEIAGAMVSVCDRHDGLLTRDDLEAYSVIRRDPIEALAGAYRLRLNPPPALGGALVTAMLSRLQPGDEDGPVVRARIIDAVDRFWRQAPSDPGRLLGRPAPQPPGTASRGTTHVSVIDADGRAAAATVSNGEGNGRIVPGCGFMLNNILGEDDLNPDGFHRWQPQTRLGSMMTPGVALGPDGDIIAFGSGGSNRIRTAILQAVLNRCRLGMALPEAVAAPRLHVERGHLDFEDQFSAGDRESLIAAFSDHTAWPDQNLYFGGVHAVERTARGGFVAAGDPRRGGASRIV